MNSAQPGPRYRRKPASGVPEAYIVRAGDTERLFNAHTALDEWAASGDFRMTIEPYEPKCSSAQHGLFYAWCEILARHMRMAGQPCSKVAVHDWILGTVYGWEDLGMGRTRPRETLTRPHRKGKLRMMELLSRFEAEAAEQYDCKLPRPKSWDADLAEAHKEAEQRRAA